jgi:hypothetical protein
MKRGVIHSLISETTVTFQDQKEFNKEIKIRRYYLMLNDYPQELNGSTMKPPRTSLPSSNMIGLGMIITPHVTDISHQFKCTGNCLNAGSIFKTTHTVCETLIKTGLITDAQQMRNCVHHIPCDCGRCYIRKTSISLEAHI